MEVETLRLEILKIAAESQKSGEPRNIIAAAKSFEIYVTPDEKVTSITQAPKRERVKPKRKTKSG